MDDFEIHINDEPGAEEREFLEDKINEYNFQTTGYYDGRLISIKVEKDGETIAGLFGWTWGGCCEVELLWVQEQFRRQGVGKKLLDAAEQEAPAGQGAEPGIGDLRRGGIGEPLAADQPERAAPVFLRRQVG